MPRVDGAPRGRARCGASAVLIVERRIRPSPCAIEDRAAMHKAVRMTAERTRPPRELLEGARV